MTTATGTVIAFPESEVSLVDAFLRGLPTAGTRKVYLRSITAFGSYLGSRDLLAATRRDIEAWRAHLEEAGRAPATIALALSSLTSLYEYAVDEEVIDRNTAARARRPKLPAHSTRKGITQAEVRAMLDACEATTTIGLRDRALLLTLAIQGWRISEALGLRVEDLWEEQGHRVAEIVGKGAKHARVTLAAPVWMAIREWMEAAAITNGPVFVPVLKGGRVQPGRSQSPQAAWKRVRLLARQAGLDREIFPHLFRHGCATAALDAGVPLHQVQDHLRHADPRTTRRYDSHRMSLNNPAPHVLAAKLVTDK